MFSLRDRNSFLSLFLSSARNNIEKIEKKHIVVVDTVCPPIKKAKSPPRKYVDGSGLQCGDLGSPQGSEMA